MSQDELAEALFVSRELVSKWENGRRRPTKELVLRMTEIFSVDLDYFAPQDQRLLEELDACIPKTMKGVNRDISGIINSFLETLPEQKRTLFLRRYYFI